MKGRPRTATARTVKGVYGNMLLADNSHERGSRYWNGSEIAQLPYFLAENRLGHQDALRRKPCGLVPYLLTAESIRGIKC
jgi:hypothetical protein